MTVTAPLSTDSTSQFAATRERLRSYAIFLISAGLYLLPFMRLYLVGTDEGTLDYGAVRVFHGQVFARDFFEVIGPGTFYWIAAFFKIFGAGFFATRVCLFLTSLGVAVLMYCLTRKICNNHQALPVLVLASTIFGGLWPATSHHIDSTLFALLAVYCAAAWLQRRNAMLLLLTGALAGLTTAFLQPKGVLLFCALLVWLAVLRRRRPASLGFLIGGYLASIGLILVYFWSKNALGSLIFVNFIWPSQHYGTVNSVSYAHGIVSYYFNHWIVAKAGDRWTVLIAIIGIIPVLFVAALPVLLPALGVRFRWRLADPVVLLYWLCGIAIWLSELHRMDMPRLVFGSPLLIILCIYFLAQYPGGTAHLALQTLFVASCSLAAFNLLSLLLAAHAVPTRAGTVEMTKDSSLLSYVDNHIPPGQEIFAYPYSPRYYFLTDTVNPTPYSILVYNYNTPEQFRETVGILERRKVRYVLWDSNFARATADVFPGSTRVPPGGLIIEPYLESHYKLVQTVAGVRIMERRDDQSTDQEVRAAQ